MLEAFTYCPILYTRRAEVNALARLPQASKDLIFPILVVRPWPNANSLDAMWDKIADALGELRFGLDLDQSKLGYQSDKNAFIDFNNLFVSDGGYENYYNLLEGIPRAVPVIRLTPSGVAELDKQIERAAELDRGLILRIVHGYVVNPIALIQDVLQRAPETVVVLDAEWSRDLLIRELWVSQQISAALAVNENVEIVVAGSSFPDSFVDVNKRKNFEIEERQLFNTVQSKFNTTRIVYGDWGSTRPPQKGGGRGPHRIDLPLNAMWIIFRETDPDPESYQEIAIRVRSTSEWPRTLNIWGTYAINSTADALPGAIKGQEAAASVRINIHLHRQAQFDSLAEVSDGEEPFTD
jgi:hypothetical protein